MLSPICYFSISNSISNVNASQKPPCSIREMTFIIPSTQQRFHHLGSAKVKVKEWERADLGEPETWMCQEIPLEYHSKLLSPTPTQI